jgi:hypothetical protein
MQLGCDLPLGRMSATSGLNVPKLKQNIAEYWLADTRMNWPVKVISAARGASLGATVGKVIPVRGCVVSAKFVLGRPLRTAEQILGLNTGELMAGAVLLRLNRLPRASDFDLAGYTNVAAYPGYPPGLGSNQWVLTVDVPATVLKVTGPPGTL